MTKTFTYDDVVRYLYAETTEKENSQLVEAMALNVDLMNFYLDSLEIMDQMSKIIHVPSEKSISRILKYSAKESSKLKALPC
ncbi:hypothetical protein CLV98_10956 [Dyadobacter jejuensis]|uniref:Uncharacterized protein n=1 Tax=Dyadobacter jejuensis TaxID=1082580 RepID=A0A316B318_9BACT|nr:hypothetical protein [Dyadobacter jejuensis]PWJ56947.1 hypothetical protein CLV98_10956 [Dyadobacter jejuensis]